MRVASKRDYVIIKHENSQIKVVRNLNYKQKFTLMIRVFFGQTEQNKINETPKTFTDLYQSSDYVDSSVSSTNTSVCSINVCGLNNNIKYNTLQEYYKQNRYYLFNIH